MNAGSKVSGAAARSGAHTPRRESAASIASTCGYRASMATTSSSVRTGRPENVFAADSGPLSAKLLRNGTLKTYKGFPHGMPTTEAATINADLLAFIKG